MSKSKHQSVGTKALKLWTTLEPLPGGKWLFSKLLGFVIPYTGSIRPIVQQLTPGHAVVILRDKRRVRNHLNSVHAIALANLSELTTGLATLSGMPDGTRGILTGLQIDYTKKARGTLRAECQCDLPDLSGTDGEQQEYPVTARVYDQSNDCVATGTALWLIGPDRK